MPPPRRKLTPVEVRQRLLRRLEKRMESPPAGQTRWLSGSVSELEVEQDYLRRAIRYLEGLVTGSPGFCNPKVNDTKLVRAALFRMERPMLPQIGIPAT
jgi:hypothetical protein